MRDASLCALSIGLITLQVTASDPTRQIGDHPVCGISPLEYRRVVRATNFHDPGYLSVKRGNKSYEPQVHSRPVRTVPKKYYKSKLNRVPRDVPFQPHEGEEVPPQLPLQLPKGYAKTQQPPDSSQGAPEEFQVKEESEEEIEQDADDRGKEIPATPLFVNARYQLRSRKVPQSPILLQHPVDPRFYQQLQQSRILLTRPLNRAQLFQRIHKDNQNIDPGAESTTAVDEETCPDGEDPEAQGVQEGLALAGYNQTALLLKPNSIQEVHKFNLSKDQNSGVTPKDHLYGSNLSALPTSQRTAVSSLQHIHQMQQNPGMHQAISQADLHSQPSEGQQQLPVEEATKTPGKKKRYLNL